MSKFHFPRESNCGNEDDLRETLTALGFTVGDVFDDYFMEVELPEGWHFYSPSRNISVLYDAQKQRRGTVLIGDTACLGAYFTLDKTAPARTPSGPSL